MDKNSAVFTPESFRKAVQGKRIWVIGDAMLDEFIQGTVERQSPEAPVPVLNFKTKHYAPGGAANVALNLAGLSTEVLLFSPIAADEAGKKLRDFLHKEGISFCMPNLLACTSLKSRYMNGNTHLLRVDQEEKHSSIAGWPEAIDSFYRENPILPDLIVISDYDKGAVCPQTMRLVTQLCQEHSIPFLADPKKADWSLYNGAFWLTPNLKELGMALGQTPINTDQWVSDALSQLRERFPLCAPAVTRGNQGISYWEQGTVKHVPGKHVQAVDVCGAGDTVLAVIAAGVAAKLSAQVYFNMANTLAAKAVSYSGTVAISTHWI
jgi:rfaE bifunctional protein kinase chain/domain